jgi:hypothetical protein
MTPLRETTPVAEIISNSAGNPTERLKALEAVIEKGLQTFVEVGTALLGIRDMRLYRAQGFKTFDQYCKQRWNWGRNYANKQIRAAAVVRNLGTSVPTPQNEAQARELTQLSPDQQREVAAAVDFNRAAAEDIRAVVEEKKAMARPAPAKPGRKRYGATRKGAQPRRTSAWKASQRTRVQPKPPTVSGPYDDRSLEQQTLADASEVFKHYMLCPKQLQEKFKLRFYCKLEEFWGPRTKQKKIFPTTRARALKAGRKGPAKSKSHGKRKRTG